MSGRRAGSSGPAVGVPVGSEAAAQGRAVGVWGARAHAWSGEERQRAAGFPIDVSGRRALGFSAGRLAAREAAAVVHREEPETPLAQARHARLVIAVVAVLGRRGGGQPPHMRAMT
jgi:hypothetical protein